MTDVALLARGRYYKRWQAPSCGTCREEFNMPTIDTMTLDEITAEMTQLRARRKALKSINAASQRKIATLARRRERLLLQVSALEAQMADLRGGQQAPPSPAPAERRGRRSQAQAAASLEAILACVARHGIAQRATIITECHLSPANASAYLRQLCAEGKLLRHGEKRATTYTVV
jgi:predicted transcriptional regulator